MDLATIIVDLLALIAILVGVLMLVAQRRVRRWWRALAGSSGDPDSVVRPRKDDPVGYALTIFGMMLLAFGLIIFGFFTAFAMFTD